MTLHPITFDATSVRAIIDPRAPGYPKTMTRRVIAPDNSTVDGGAALPWWSRHPDAGLPVLDFDRAEPRTQATLMVALVGKADAPPDPHLSVPSNEESWHRVRPKWAPGDVLWVKEVYALNESPIRHPWGNSIYKATHRFKAETVREAGYSAWRSARYMPLWACRLFLRVESVRAERLWDITPRDCVAEGVAVKANGAYWGIFPDDLRRIEHREAMEARWDSLNAKRGHPWAKNDWVWATTYSVLSATGIDGLPPDVAAMVRERIERNAKARRAR